MRLLRNRYIRAVNSIYIKINKKSAEPVNYLPHSFYKFGILSSGEESAGKYPENNSNTYGYNTKRCFAVIRVFDLAVTAFEKHADSRLF